MNAMDILTKEQKDDLIRFTQDLIRIQKLLRAGRGDCQIY